MAARDWIFEHYFTADNGHKCLLEIQLPAADYLDVKTRITIPDGVFYQDMGKGASKWSERMLGVHDTPSFQIKMDLHALTGSTELDALRDAIVLPFSFAGSVPRTGTAFFRNFYTASVWRIYTDRGVLDDPTFLLFEGVQRRLPKRQYKINKRDRRTEFSVELFHIVRAVLETCAPVDVANQMLNGGYTTVTKNAIWEVIYAFNNGTQDVVEGMRRISPHQTVTGYRLVDLFDAISVQCTYIYNSFLRIDPESIDAAVFAFYAPGHSDGTPYDVFGFKKQNYLPDGLPGDPLTRDMSLFGGTYQTDDDPDIPIGGLLSQNDEHGLWHWKNMWDMLSECTKGTANKGIVVSFASGTATIEFQPLKATGTGQTPGPLEIPISTNEISDDNDVTQGEGVITAAVADIPGSSGNDAKNIIVAAPDQWGVESEEKQELPTVFHNAPLLGSLSDFYLFSDNPGITADVVLQYDCRRWIALQLFYEDTPSFLAESAFIRIHDVVTINDGVSDREFCAEVEAYPQTGGQVFNGDPPPSSLRRNLFKRQASSSMPFAVASLVSEVFSSQDNSTYQITAPIEYGYPEQTGNGVDGTELPDASVLQADATYLEGIPGSPFVQGTAYDVQKGTSELTLATLA